MNNNVNKQKGIILPVVLIFFSFLMLLGVTFVSVGGFQVTQSMRQVNRSQAYYLAKSGAESFANYVIDEVIYLSETEGTEKAQDFLNQITDEELVADLNHSIKGKIEIDVNKTENIYEVTSTGHYNGEESNSTIRIKTKLTSVNNQSNIVIPGNKKVTLINTSYADGINHPNGNGKLKIEDDEVIENNPSPQEIIIPDILNIKPYNNENNIVLNESVYYNSDIRKDSEWTITVGNSSTPIVMKVKSLDLRNDLIIINPYNTQFVIFIEESLGFYGTNEININQGNSPEEFIIISNGENHINDDNKKFRVNFSGILYAPKSSVYLHSNSEISGAIVVNNLTIHSNTLINGSVMTSSLTYKDAESIVPSGINYEIPSGFNETENNDITIGLTDNPWN